MSRFKYLAIITVILFTWGKGTVPCSAGIKKLIEESPSPHISERLREEICKAAIKIARAVNYTNAGTVEFLVDKEGNFYFIEVNTRLQVEHPVTEMVTGIDLVKQQIMIAYGERLNVKQKKFIIRVWL